MKVDRDEILGDTADVQERLRAAAESATTGRGTGMDHHLHHHHTHANRRAAERARQAREWARSHWSDLQDRVERRPYSATAWALGIGFLTGIVLTSMVRNTSRRGY